MADEKTMITEEPRTDAAAEALATAKANAAAKFAEIEARDDAEPYAGAEEEEDAIDPDIRSIPAKDAEPDGKAEAKAAPKDDTKELPEWAKSLGLTADEAAVIGKRPETVERIERTLSAPKKADDGDAKQRSDDSAARDGDESDSRIAKLEAEIRSLRTKLERVPDALDDLAIRSGHADIFGKERWIAPDSKEQANRAKLREFVEVLRDGYARKGRTVPPDEELVATAIRAQFADELAASRSEPKRARESQMIARPNPRRDREIPEGRERAVANARELIRERTRG